MAEIHTVFYEGVDPGWYYRLGPGDDAPSDGPYSSAEEARREGEYALEMLRR